MKLSLFLFALLMLTSSCDSPQRNRIISSANSGNGYTQPANTNTPNPWGTGTTSSSTGTATGGSTSGAQTKPPGFENCDISANQYAAVIGYMGICQSTLDETSVAVNSTITDSIRTCLIPTYKDQAGSSTYLGQPQCFLPKQGEVTMGKLYKTRNGFTSYAINGVMVMKERSLTAYFTCMDAYVTFTDPRCPYGAKTNAYCDQMARSVMATKCNNFKMDNPYLDIRLK